MTLSVPSNNRRTSCKWRSGRNVLLINVESHSLDPWIRTLGAAIFKHLARESLLWDGQGSYVEETLRLPNAAYHRLASYTVILVAVDRYLCDVDVQ